MKTHDKSLTEILKKISEYDYPIIVEGRKDKDNLEKLGVNNEIYAIRGPLYEFCSKIAGKYDHVIILTDFDLAGRRLAAKLAGFFQALGVNADLRLRKELFASAKQKHVESLRE